MGKMFNTHKALAPATHGETSAMVSQASAMNLSDPVPGPAPQGDWTMRVQYGKRVLARLFPAHAPKLASGAEDENSAETRAAILVAPCAGARKLLITFGGNAGYLVLSPAVKNLPMTHVIAIRDPKRCFSLCGVAGLGDSYETCLENLRLLMDSLGAVALHCFGVSAGGYSALRYGLDLGAYGVLAMSAPTTLDLADDPGATLADYPYLCALYKRRPELGVDLAGLYAETLPRPRALLLYAPSHARDKWLATRMRGIAGVNLEKTDAKAGHRVLQEINQVNGLAPFLKRLRGMRPLTDEREKPVPLPA